MLVRNALCRLAAEAPKASPHDLPHSARVLRRSLSTRSASTTPAARALSRVYLSIIESRRSYATASATKPTATVKKAVKANAAKKTTAKKATTTKKPAAKKTTAKKKKKPAAKKPAPKKRVKKELTPEEKETAKIAALKKIALKAPTNPRSLTAFNVYLSEQVSKSGGQKKLGDSAKGYKDLTPAEVEHYNHLANQQTEERRAEYKRWIESHTVAEIRAANNARIRLRKIWETKATSEGKAPAGSSQRFTAKLHDERAAKLPVRAHSFFLQDRYASGDMKGLKLGDAVKLINNEWKALSASEKQKYEDQAQADKERWARESSAESS